MHVITCTRLNIMDEIDVGLINHVVVDCYWWRSYQLHTHWFPCFGIVVIEMSVIEMSVSHLTTPRQKLLASAVKSENKCGKFNSVSFYGKIKMILMYIFLLPSPTFKCLSELVRLLWLFIEIGKNDSEMRENDSIFWPNATDKLPI